MKKILVLAAMLAAVMGSVTTTASASIVVAYWNQNSNALPGGGFGFLADPSVFPQAADVGSGTLSVGGGITGDTETTGGGDVVYQWIQSFAGSTVNAQVGDTSGGSIALRNGTNGGNNGAFFQFAIDMTNMQGLVVSYATQRTSSGFTTQQWSWSTDGATFTNFQVVDSIPTSFGAIILNPISALDNVASAFLRVTFDGGSTTSATGNNRLDNITFSATAVPEPSALLLVGSVLGAGFLRRRRS